jgi:hypothetical protein
MDIEDAWGLLLQKIREPLSEETTDSETEILDGVGHLIQDIPEVG